MIKKIISGLTLLLLISCQQTWELQSPEKSITMTIMQDNMGRVFYSVFLNGNELIKPSRLSIMLNNEKFDFSKKISCINHKESLIHEEYTMLSGKRKNCINHANELILTFKNKKGGKADFIFRAYEDGVAYRYQLYNTDHDTIKEEISAFVLDSTTTGWLAEYRSDYEMFYPLRKLDTLDNRAFICPALFKTTSNQWILASDAAVYGNYAAMHLRHIGKGEMRFSIPNQLQPGSPWYPGTWEELTMKEDTLIEVNANHQTPWRMLMIGNSIGTIIESTLTENLNPPCELNDTSWIKPGIACFPWWSDDIANDKPERLKKFIDMAAEMGWKYLEFDIGLLGNNGGYAIDKWRTIAYIPEIINYAKKKGVEVYGWDERKFLDTPEKRADIFGKYKEWGVAGIKIDFLNSDKQEANAFREEALRDAAKYQLLVSFHGDITPKGLRRRFPNFMTQEGVRGEEYYKFASDNDIPTPEHNCMLPFTRNVVGPMDYTPTGFSGKRRTTSYGHELALPIIYESGWTCMADAPEEFLKSPAKDFLQSLHASWDDTRFISGYPGEYIVIARRKGNSWYVAGINSGIKRWATMSFDFLKTGEYKVKCYRDPQSSDGSWTAKKDVNAWIVADSITISSEYPQYFPIEANGGFVFVIHDSAMK